MLGWDTRVALAFAAEELCLTAQALTSDVISREQGLEEAHSHLRRLLQHASALPGAIALRLRKLEHSYSQRENSGATDKAGGDLLIAGTMMLLTDVRDVLEDRLRDNAPLLENPEKSRRAA